MCRAVSSLCRGLDTGLLFRAALLFKAALRVRDRLAGPAVLLANHALITNDRTLGDVDLPCHRAFIQASFAAGKGAFLHSWTSSAHRAPQHTATIVRAECSNTTPFREI